MSTMEEVPNQDETPVEENTEEVVSQEPDSQVRSWYKELMSKIEELDSS